MPTIATTIELPDRFINREKYENIKTRVGRLPSGEYVTEGDNIYCWLLDEEGRRLKKILVATIHYPGAIEAFAQCKDDSVSMLKHIENADAENDILLERISNVYTDEKY